MGEERLTEEQVSLVFARAAELDAEHPGGPEVALDLAAVEEVGRQVGLSTGAIRRAVAEMRAGTLVPAPAAPATGTRHLVGPPVTRVVRSVPGPARVVHEHLGRALGGQLLEPRRHQPLRSTWVQRRGLAPQLRRGFDFAGKLHLTGIERLDVTVTEPPGDADGPVIVRLDAALEATSRVVGASFAAGGGAGAAAMALGAGFAEPLAAGLGAAAAGVGGVGWLAARTSYRRSIAAVEEALHGMLDRIEHRADAGRPTSRRRSPA